MQDYATPYNAANQGFMEVCGVYSRRTGFWSLWFLNAARPYYISTAVSRSVGGPYEIVNWNSGVAGTADLYLYHNVSADTLLLQYNAGADVFVCTVKDDFLTVDTCVVGSQRNPFGYIEGGGVFQWGESVFVMAGHGCCFCTLGSNGYVWRSDDGPLGNYSFVGGGQNNTASGHSSVVAGGYFNTASGYGSVCGGGIVNVAATDYSFVGGGSYSTASTSLYATVCGGSSHTVSGQYAFVGGGNSNAASGRSSFIGGGEVHTASGTYSAVMGGCGGNTRSIIGYHVFPACLQPISSATGVTQSALLLLGRQTSDATATVLRSNNQSATTTNQVILPNNAAYYFRGSVIAGVTAGGNSKAWTFEGAIKRGANAASTAIVGSVILNTIAQDAGASAWTVAITADTTNGGIAVTVTGAASTTIRWVAKIETTEMTY
jgi:hypothetical protein